ncbi:MAG: TlpA disulfide reductase family protein, partial [Chloracidobacterium sp.]
MIVSRLFLASLLSLGGLLGAACQPASTESPASPPANTPPSTPATSPPRAANPAPTFTVETFNTGAFDLSNHRGKVVVVNFWATWCPPCVAEMPGFDATYRRLKGDGLEIVGLSLDQEGPSVVKAFLAKRPISYPIAMGDSTIATR